MLQKDYEEIQKVNMMGFETNREKQEVIEIPQHPLKVEVIDHMRIHEPRAQSILSLLIRCLNCMTLREIAEMLGLS